MSATKRARIEEEEEESLLADVQGAIETLDSVQDELERVNEKVTAEILKIEAQYEKERSPIYERRREVINNIPNFWMQAMINHPVIRLMIEAPDLDALKYLLTMEVTMLGDSITDFKMEFTFKDNPYFFNSSLWKEFRHSGEEFDVRSSVIEWKEGKNLTQAIEEEEKEGKRTYSGGNSFFEWFDPEETDVEAAREIKDTLWTNPLKYYMSAGGDDEDDDDEEGDVLYQEGEDDDEDDDDGEEKEEA